MNLTDTLLSEAWYWAAWAVWLPCFALCLFKAPWFRLKDSELLNVWLGMVVLLTVIWSLKAGVKPGLDFHLLGVTVFVLCFGPYLAFVGLCLVLAGVTANGASGVEAYALNAMLLPGVGVVICQLFQRLVNSCLPANFFIYVFINGFLGAVVTTISIGFVASLFLAISGVYGFEYLFSEYFPYFMLLAFSEAWLSGMVVTLFVIYRPAWVVTFDDSRYLANK